MGGRFSPFTIDHLLFTAFENGLPIAGARCGIVGLHGNATAFPTLASKGRLEGAAPGFFVRLTFEVTRRHFAAKLSPQTWSLIESEHRLLI
jgi:hypothetical protein